MKSALTTLLCFASLTSALTAEKTVELAHFRRLFSKDPTVIKESALEIAGNWQDSYTPLLIESLRFAPEKASQLTIAAILATHTGLDKDSDLTEWWHWAWKKPYQPHPEYAEFKAGLYELIDPRFREYFDENPKSEIRLDEIRWGGVLRDGIPPLKDPKTIKAAQADYLKDDHVVFGVSFNGEARAYPKRILAWHEMVKDTVGGRSINGVYCTLCGSMIVYDTLHNKKHYELGTSGFLYRSNKLMYDHETQSMWSTIEGKPVVGPLVGKGIQLKPLTVVTSTWGEWRKRHPDTTVLSLDTGFQRDYGEGVAYNSYFSTDRLMFAIPQEFEDKRLLNKDSILALRFGKGPKDKVAFAPKLLKKHPIYPHRHGDTEVVVLTDRSGASRVYETKGQVFEKWDQGVKLTDKNGLEWTLTEDALTSKSGQSLARFPSHNAFWFGWRSAYPETHLVQ